MNLENILDSVPNPLMVVDRELRIVRANRESARYLGDIEGRRCYEAMGCGKESSKNCCAKHAFNGKRWKGVIRTESLRLLVNAEPVFEDGEIKYVLLTATDVSGLYGGEIKYHEILENSTDMLSITDIKGRIVDVNSVFEKIMHYERGEVLGRRWSEFVHPDDVEKLLEALKKSLREGRGFSIELRGLTKEGKRIYLEGKVEPLIRDNRIEGFMGIYRDVSERKELENRLRELVKNYRTFFDMSPAIIVVHDGERILLANKRAAEYSGLKNPEQLVGLRIINLLHPDSRDIAVERIRKIFKDRVVLPPIHEKFVLPNGEVRIFHVSSGYITYGGKPAILTVMNDVTELIGSYERVKELNDALIFVNKTLRHNVLNSLTSAQIFLEALTEKYDRKLINKVSQSIDRAVKSIKSIRNLENVLIRKELSPTSLKKIFDEIIEKFGDYRIRLEGEAVVLADESISLVFENVIENAFKHGKTDEVLIKIEQEGRYALIKISDFGVGIPESIKKRIFEESFSYGDSAHTGMGLYISKKIVKFFGGDMWVEDNTPRGTTFVIKLRTS